MDHLRLRIASIGEILWDIFDTGRYLGGAPFNFAAHAARLGHHALMISAVGADELGAAALNRMRELHVDDRFVACHAGLPTGIVTVALDAAGQPAYTIHHPAAYDRIAFTADQLTALAPDWIYFGTLQPHADEAGPASTIVRAIDAAPHARRFYDINLRPASYAEPLVRRLLSLANVVKLNVDEMHTLAGATSIEAFCRDWAARYHLDALCVTRGAEGCALSIAGQYAEFPAVPVPIADTVGAGDAFSAAFLHGLSHGWPIDRIGPFANRVGALVASRPGGTPDWHLDEVAE